jgi:hypothetical protein
VIVGGGALRTAAPESSAVVEPVAAD